MSLHMIGVKQIFLWAGWCDCTFKFFHEVMCIGGYNFWLKISSMVIPLSLFYFNQKLYV